MNKTSKEYCLAISSAKVMSCLGEWGVVPLLPHRMPNLIPQNWESKFKGKYIESQKLENTKGYTFDICNGCSLRVEGSEGKMICFNSDCSNFYNDDEYSEVIPLQLPGLVYIKDMCFLYKGKPIIFKKKDNDVLGWNGKDYYIKEKYYNNLKKYYNKSKEKNRKFVCEPCEIHLKEIFEDLK